VAKIKGFTVVCSFVLCAFLCFKNFLVLFSAGGQLDKPLFFLVPTNNR